MQQVKFILPKPEWDSDLTQIILELEKLRTKMLYGEIPPYIFFQLKDIFQRLETLGSARIEGNKTTLAEYVEKIIEGGAVQDEKQQELDNIEDAIAFIEKNTTETTVINKGYILELHKIITKNLTPPRKGEGSHYPGELRRCEVTIENANHKPITHVALTPLFDEFIDFINQDLREQNQLLMVAITHHLFMHIHPFDNGNGRMGRLLNYACLIKMGFNVKKGRLLNPSSVFYSDRNKYYEMLGRADSLQQKDLLAWSEYFLLGLKNEIEKIDSLLEPNYTREKILVPMLKYSLDKQHITQQEYAILNHLIQQKKMVLKSSQLEDIGIKGSQAKSYAMQKLRDKKIVKPLKDSGRIYTINFVNNYLLRGIIHTLEEEGFISDFLN